MLNTVYSRFAAVTLNSSCSRSSRSSIRSSRSSRLWIVVVVDDDVLVSN
jgi:hypothetical protein